MISDDLSPTVPLLTIHSQRKQYEPISLGRIQQYIDLKRLDPTEPITVEHIFKSGMVAGFRRTNGFKLLADGVRPLSAFHSLSNPSAQRNLQQETPSDLMIFVLVCRTVRNPQATPNDPAPPRLSSSDPSSRSDRRLPLYHLPQPALVQTGDTARVV